MTGERDSAVVRETKLRANGREGEAAWGMCESWRAMVGELVGRESVLRACWETLAVLVSVESGRGRKEMSEIEGTRRKESCSRWEDQGG